VSSALERVPVGRSYILCSAPANTADAILCDSLARHAVHAAMAGRTDVMIGLRHDHFVHVPIALAVAAERRVASTRRATCGPRSSRRPGDRFASRRWASSDGGAVRMRSMDDASRLARGNWPVRRFRLGHEPGDDLSRTTSAAERVAMVWQLTLDSWASSGQAIPDYPRRETPITRRSLVAKE
jgi:hypothetical protein